MKRKLLFFVGTIVVLVGVGKSAILIANTMANEQGKEIERAKQIFIDRYPKTPDNASAIKLRELAIKLGFLLVVKPESAKLFKISETDTKEFSAIRPELDKYIDAQVAKPTDSVDIPPEKLRQYLQKKEATLAAIRTHILKSEIPQWETDIGGWIEKGDVYDIPPDSSDIVKLQKLFALDALEKNRLGQTKAMLENLQASWKLKQSLENRPEVESQFVNLKITKIQAGTIRKVNNLPVEWQQKILNRDYRKDILNTFEGETFYNDAAIKKIRFLTAIGREYKPSLTDLSSNNRRFYWLFSLVPVITFLSSPIDIDEVYAHWMAIDYNQYRRFVLSEISKENLYLCSPNSVFFNKQLAWWNIFGQIPKLPSMPAIYWRQDSRIMLELEMTQKVLQAKSEADKAGKWPRSLPNLESSVCPGFKWVYQVSPDGEMSLSFSPIPQWVKSESPSEKRVELNYRDREINRSK